MNWFGESWGAACCDPAEHVTTPVGEACLSCTLPIRRTDRGLVLPHLGGTPERPTHALRPHHLDCFLGSVGILSTTRVSAPSAALARFVDGEPMLVTGDARPCVPSEAEFEQHLQRADRRIREVYVFGNGMVAVVDQWGQQMPEYQGPVDEVIARVREAAGADALWHVAPNAPRSVTDEIFRS